MSRREPFMAEPRIWFDPPAFSWGRVLRIGALWLALVLLLLLPLGVVEEHEESASSAYGAGTEIVTAQPP